MNTKSQSLSSSSPLYQFGRAPGLSGGPLDYWQSAGVEVDKVDGQTQYYYIGTFSAGSSLDFGCGSMSNPQDSYRDVFIVAFDSTGFCKWQRHFGSDTTGPLYTTYDLFAADLTVTSDGHPVFVYKQYVDPFFADPFGSSRIVELDSTGSTLWSTSLSGISNEYKMIEAIDAGGGALVATGTYDSTFSFAGSSISHPSGSAEEAMILRWGALSNGSRPEDWGKGFGGNDDNVPSDVAVHGSSGDIAAVGNFFGDHTDLNGTTTGATNASFFVQTVDSAGNHLDAYASPNNPSQSDDDEYLTSVDFNAAGELFMAGRFHGNLDPNGNFASNTKVSIETNPAAQDVDFFAIGFPDANSIGNDNWFTQSGYYNPGGNIDPTKKAITYESIAELTAKDGYVAITGRVCDLSDECIDDGFAHLYESTVNGFPQTPDYGNLDVTYENSSETFYGSSIDHRSGEFVVGGYNTDTNYTFPGGFFTLPGGYDFIVSYTF